MAKGTVNTPPKTSGFATKEELNKITLTPGPPGPQGVGIVKIEQTITSAEDGGTNVITVTLSNEQTFTFEVKNGSKGVPGDPGKPGANGKSAYDLAKEAGYEGTEEDLAEALASMGTESASSALKKQTITLSTDWTEQEDGTFAQTVAVEGVTGDAAQPIWADCDLTREDLDADVAVLEAWGCIQTAEPGEGTMTFYCYGDVPSVSIPVKVVVSV